jgi:hypothetical protein
MTRPSAARPPTQAQNKPAVVAAPFRPHRGLFFALLGIFILWLMGLVALYITTVYHKTDVHVRSATQSLAE